jgi:PKHD-type hydroxylase
LLVNDHAGIKTASKERGTVHLFPSYMPHKVTPITRGTRYSLVIWVHGSRRFR